MKDIPAIEAEPTADAPETTPRGPLKTWRPRSGPAEGLLNLFLRHRRLRIVREFRPGVVRVRQHINKFMQFIEATGLCGCDGGLDPVIAGNEHWIDRPHVGTTRVCGLIFA